MTEKIARRGVKTPSSYEPDVLEKLTVEQILTDDGMIISEENSIKEVREWLKIEQEFNSNYFIISTNDGEYRGILSSSNLLSDHHLEDNLIGSLIRRNNIYISVYDTLKTAAETMAKENIDVLPVVSSDKKIIGVLSYRDIIASYKSGIDEHEKKQPNISLKRKKIKILLRGHKIISSMKKKIKK